MESKAHVPEHSPPGRLIGCTDRGRAGYPSDSSWAGRERQVCRHPRRRRSESELRRLGDYDYAFSTMRHLRHRRPRRGRGGAGCVPFTLSRGSRAIAARPAADFRIGCTRSLVTELRASSQLRQGRHGCSPYRLGWPHSHESA